MGTLKLTSFVQKGPRFDYRDTYLSHRGLSIRFQKTTAKQQNHMRLQGLEAKFLQFA
jgi:hypothetical protein